MKKIVFLLLIFCSIVHTAEVDKRFFANESKKAYLAEMEANITVNPDKNISTIESALFKQIISQDQKNVQIGYAKEEIALDQRVDLADFTKSIARYTKAKETLEQSRKKAAELSSKLEYVKKQIKNITQAEKVRLRIFQLQYTLYKQLLDQEKGKIAMLDEALKSNEKLFVSMLTQLATEGYEERLMQLEKDHFALEAQRNKIAELDVKIEHNTFLESQELEQLLKERKLLEENLNTASIITAQSMLDIVLFELALKKDELFYHTLKKTDNVIAAVTSAEKKTLELHLQLLRSLGKEYFGMTSAAVIASKASLTETLNYFVSLLFEPLFVFNEKAVSSADILKILLIFVVGGLVASFYRRRILRWSSGWVMATPMTAKVVANFGYYFIIIVTFLVAINSVGIDLSSFSMFASALAIGIGFGLQTVVSNMVSGIIMMFERSVRIGDFVELSDALSGTVMDIRIRSTVIKTLDNIDIVVPNSSFIQNNVINFTLDDSMRRLHVPFSVAYGTEVDKVKQVILDALLESELDYYRGINEKRQPSVRMMAMGASSVDYELLVWVDWDTKKLNVSKSDFLILVYNALNKHGIEIPFPQIDLHLKSPKGDTLHRLE